MSHLRRLQAFLNDVGATQQPCRRPDEIGRLGIAVQFDREHVGKLGWGVLTV